MYGNILHGPYCLVVSLYSNSAILRNSCIVGYCYHTVTLPRSNACQVRKNCVVSAASYAKKSEWYAKIAYLGKNDALRCDKNCHDAPRQVTKIVTHASRVPTEKIEQFQGVGFLAQKSHAKNPAAASAQPKGVTMRCVRSVLSGVCDNIYRTPTGSDGICRFCDEWTAELNKRGMCEEKECQHRRLVKALQVGEKVVKGQIKIKDIPFYGAAQWNGNELTWVYNS